MAGIRCACSRKNPTNPAMQASPARHSPDVMLIEPNVRVTRAILLRASINAPLTRQRGTDHHFCTGQPAVQALVFLRGLH